jgi:2-polyprenyl-3-methyl-5-hydroxy-6-metoxy-1,4-benzoquinol methylase
MDTPEQAAAYSEGDFSEAHQWFADEVARRFPELREGTGVLVDLGCGPADVTVRLARACPGWTITGIDGATEMLRLGHARLAREGLADRISLEARHLGRDSLLGRRFDALVSNSLLHHLADPQVLWAPVAACLPPGAPIAVMDLRRPAGAAELDELVARYTTSEPPVLQDDFRNSLHAAYRPDEVTDQLQAAGLGHLAVEVVSDRHLLVTGRR